MRCGYVDDNCTMNFVIFFAIITFTGFFAYIIPNIGINFRSWHNIIIEANHLIDTKTYEITDLSDLNDYEQMEHIKPRFFYTRRTFLELLEQLAEVYGIKLPNYKKINNLIIFAPLIVISLTFFINWDSFFDDSYIDIDKEPVAPEINQSEALAAIQSLEAVGKSKYDDVWTDYEDDGVTDFNPVFFDYFENDYYDSYFINYYFDETGAISDIYFSYHYSKNDAEFILNNFQKFLTFASTDLETAGIIRPINDFKPLYVIDQKTINAIKEDPKNGAAFNYTLTIEDCSYDTLWNHTGYNDDIPCINYEIHFNE